MSFYDNSQCLRRLLAEFLIMHSSNQNNVVNDRTPTEQKHLDVSNYKQSLDVPFFSYTSCLQYWFWNNKCRLFWETSRLRNALSKIRPKVSWDIDIDIDIENWHKKTKRNTQYISCIPLQGIFIFVKLSCKTWWNSLVTKIFFKLGESWKKYRWGGEKTNCMTPWIVEAFKIFHVRVGNLSKLRWAGSRSWGLGWYQISAPLH